MNSPASDPLFCAKRPHLADFRWRVAIHESGHAAVALLFGKPLASLTIEPRGDALGQCFTAETRPWDPVGWTDLERAYLYLAGEAAELLHFGSVTAGGSESDYQHAKAALTRFNRNPRRAPATLGDVKDGCKRLLGQVETQWATECVAKCLYHRTTLAGQEVADLFTAAKRIWRFVGS